MFRPSNDGDILVVGDLILDRYVYGDTHGISPEAPVPVIRVASTEERPGGAANVAMNIKCLGMQVKLIGITGNDESATTLNEKLSNLDVACHFFHQQGFPTITKLRVLSQNQQLLRMDYETDAENADATALFDIYAEHVGEASLIVLSDYAKGSLHKVEDFIKSANDHELPVFIDPKGHDFTRYRDATVLTPNYKEFETIVGRCINESDIHEKGVNLCTTLSLDALLITRGKDGVTLIDKTADEVMNLPAKTHEVFDVTGAGDTVIAVFSAAVASGYEYRDAVYFANSAAGVVVEKLGAATVTVNELNSVLGFTSSADDKYLAIDDLLKAINISRYKGEKIVMTNGCFDILHVGHVAYLNKAKASGHRLLVAINDDGSVRNLKGEDRPLQDLDRRVAVLSGLASVDWLIAFSEDTPEKLIELIKPDLLVKGGDYSEDDIAGAEQVRKYGGEVKVLPCVADISTSSIVDKIKKIRGTG